MHQLNKANRADVLAQSLAESLSAPYLLCSDKSALRLAASNKVPRSYLFPILNALH